jgi:ABC-2 type transport system permease protein
VNALAAFGRFEVGRLLRSWKFLTITVGFPVLFYMLFLRDHHAGQIVYAGVQWREYLMVSMCSFGALIAALNAGGSRVAMERAGGWARQLRVTPMPAWSYVAVKMTASMVVVLPVVLLVELVAATFGGVSLTAWTWVGLSALLWLTAVPFAALGVLVGFAVGTEAVFPVVTGLMFVLAYFGGLFTPVDRMPGVLQAAARVLPNFQHLSLGLEVLDGHALGLSHWLVLAGYTAGLCALIVWRHRVEEARGVA